MGRLDLARIADILARSSVWARLALTSGKPALVERAADALAACLVAKLAEPEPLANVTCSPEIMPLADLMCRLIRGRRPSPDHATPARYRLRLEQRGDSGPQLPADQLSGKTARIHGRMGVISDRTAGECCVNPRKGRHRLGERSVSFRLVAVVPLHHILAKLNGSIPEATLWDCIEPHERNFCDLISINTILNV
jgi:hypothetical protein